MDKVFYKVDEASKKIGVSTRTLYKMVENKKIEFIDLNEGIETKNRQIVFTKEHIKNFLSQISKKW